MNDELFNTKQAAFYCGLSPSNLANKRVYGGGPYFLKLGAKVSYRKSDLDEWLLANRFDKREKIPDDHDSRVPLALRRAKTETEQKTHAVDRQ